MKKLTVAALTALLMSGAAAYAQNNQQHNPHGGPGGNPPPPNNHAPANSNTHAPGGNPPPPNNHGPNNPNPNPQVVHGGPAGPQRGQQAVQVRGGGLGQGVGSGRHHLPPGIAIPTAHHPQPVWHGRSWAIGDMFILTGFDGPYISTWGDYGLPPPRRGTHWIYVDGYYLMIGNRTGRIFAEVPADY